MQNKMTNQERKKMGIERSTCRKGKMKVERSSDLKAINSFYLGYVVNLGVVPDSVLCLALGDTLNIIILVGIAIVRGCSKSSG
jgi:hypothetical protein